jgi:RNA polymerase sigma factor for flagellar operon FliA
MRAYASSQRKSVSERDRLIADHIEIARRIALRVARRCPDWIGKDDLVAAGLMGLAEAADRYDESRNEPFLVFAEKRIRGAVLDELRRGDIMPRRQRQMARTVGRTIQRLEQELGQPPEDEQVAKALGVPVQEYRDQLEGLIHVSIGAFDGDDADHLGSSDAQSPAAQVEHKQMLASVRRGLGKLVERDLQVLNLYYSEELTYAEIGELLGITTSRVCQLHGRAVARLRAEVEREDGVGEGAS